MCNVIKYNNGDLNKFLFDYKTVKGGDFTHTSLGSPMGSYYVPIEKEDEFFKLYTGAVKYGENLYLTEKHKMLSSILLDFDFRFIVDDNIERLYTSEHILEIVKNYVNILSEYCDTESIKVYVFEKPTASIYKDNIGKDGIHILIPEVVSRPALQYIIRDKFIEKMKTYFKDIGYTNDIEDIYDKAVIEKNNWLLYGSTKPNSQIYKLTRIYKVVNNKILSESNLQEKKLSEYIKLFSIRNKYNEKKIKTEKLFEVNKYDKILSDESKKKDILAQATYKYPQSMNLNTSDNIELIKKFVKVLSTDRAKNYDSWIRLGWCLRAIDYRLLDSWIDFSRKSEKYSEGECENLWERMRDTGLGIGTLRMWAKQDNPNGYSDVIRGDWKQYLYKAVTRTDYDLAQVVFNMFKYDYVCCSIRNNLWYQFRNHRWEPIDSGYTLRHHLSTDVVKAFMGIISEYNKKAMEEQDPDELTRLQDQMARYMKVINDLKNTSKKNNILKECAELFYYEKFETKLDSNVNLIGFTNGVYDLELLEFREGRPDDYISFSTNINYIEYDEKNIMVSEINEFVSKVMPKKHLMEYIMKCLASFLNGRIREEKFHIWTGNGSNGKSKLTELYQKAFGDYCGSFNVSMLTQKRGLAGGTNAELVKAKGKRFMVLQEPSENERINVGLMKELTGGDTVQARGLYKDPIEFKPQFKLVLTCNDLPAVPADDGGTWRRVRVLPFTSHFVEIPDPRNPNEFALDNELSDKLENWKEVFMSMLVKYYKEYLQTGLVEPAEVIERTEKYRKENDSYSEYVYTRVEFMDKKSSVYITDLYDDFKWWWKENMPSGKTPGMPDFRKSLDKQFGVAINGKWRGIKITSKEMMSSSSKFVDEDNNRINKDDDM